MSLSHPARDLHFCGQYIIGDSSGMKIVLYVTSSHAHIIFDLKDCADHPSHVKLDLCNKDDILFIAACSGINDFKESLKWEIKRQVSRVLGESMYGVHAVMGVAISPGFASARV